MKRRALLQATAAAGVPLAGCLEGEEAPESAGDADGGGSPTGTDGTSPTGTDAGGSGDDETGTEREGTDGSTDGETTETGTSDEGDEETPAETDEGTPGEGDSPRSNAMIDRSFEVVSSDCGQGVQRATVERRGDRVDVDGTIRGRNGCYTAELEEATYDDGTDELTVAVRSVDHADEGEACRQCIVDVDYRATFEFEDGTPADVSVVHDGEHVTTG